MSLTWNDSPVSYKIAVESLKIALVFKPKLYEYPKDNFGLKIIGKYNLIKMTGLQVTYYTESFPLSMTHWPNGVAGS